MKLGLDNMRALQRALDFPDRRYRIVHVAGTNGKGSVSTKIAAGLQAAGFRVGLYTSPHISDPCERIRVNGIPIPSVDRYTFDLPATYFERMTATAFQYFAEEQVDWAVIETGLGGRLDATNIVSPDLVVITSISLDHTEHLGNTLEEVAAEKAAIAKSGVPLILGPTAQLIDLPAIRVNGPFADYMEENSAVAKAALQALGIEPNPESLEVMPPCRFQKIGNVIFDVAHNPEGLRRLFEAINRRYPNQEMTVLAGFSKEKDIPACRAVIETRADAFYHIHVDHEWLVPGEVRFDQLPELNGLVVVCGSFFIMDEALQYYDARRFASV